MKKRMIKTAIRLFLGCIFLLGCAPVSGPTEAANTQTFIAPTTTLTVTPTATMTPRSTHTPTPTPFQIILPARTLSAQESESAILELLRTNGNCTGKCIAGIRPDEMTLQEAVDVISQWGMVSNGISPLGHTYNGLKPFPLYGKVGVYLDVWTNKFAAIDRVSFAIRNVGGGGNIETDLWEENRNIWKGFRMDNLLKAYGVPSYVGYEFYRGSLTPQKRSMGYIMEIQFEDTQLTINSQAMAYYDGKNVFLCPTKDPQYFTMDIYPERPLYKRQEFASVTWQALTDTDIEAFYQKFTDETNPDACLVTPLEKIAELQPDFN